MIKIISTDTSPSLETYGKIAFVNHLNKAGYPATLYGESSWPATQCNYGALTDFFANSGDIVINDGFVIRNRWYLLNLYLHRYSHGRKMRVKQLLSFFREVIKNYPLAFSHLDIIDYSLPHKLSKKTKGDKSLSRRDDYKLSRAVATAVNASHIKVKSSEKNYIYCSDIERGCDLKKKIEQHTDKNFYIASAIRDPNYFRNEVIPLLQSLDNLFYTGLPYESIQFKVKKESHIFNSWIQLLQQCYHLPMKSE